MTTRERNQRKKLAYRNALTDMRAYASEDKGFAALKRELVATGRADIAGYEKLRLPGEIRKQLKRNGVWC